jgi:5-methyltetrahydrofolate--homocysteine methyltransferase
MVRELLKKRIEKGLFMLDGAMGTLLMQSGIKPGSSMILANIEQGQIVAGIHKSYIDAGSDAVITNTFSANPYALKKYNLSDRVAEINKAAARLARQAAGDEKYVLGNLGPTGDFLEPVGALKPAEVLVAYMKQVQALLEAEVDGIIIETMTAVDEIKIAIQAVKKTNPQMPVFASMSFDPAAKSFRTPMGIDVSTAVSAMVDAGADYIGFNCGTIPIGDYERLASEFVAISRALGENRPVYAEPNAGLPTLEEGKVYYGLQPDDFAVSMLDLYHTGVHIIGGCCGTTPDHIKATSALLKKHLHLI